MLVRVMPPGGEDRVDLDGAAVAGRGIDSAPDAVQGPAQRVAHLVQ